MRKALFGLHIEHWEVPKVYSEYIRVELKRGIHVWVINVKMQGVNDKQAVIPRHFEPRRKPSNSIPL